MIYQPSSQSPFSIDAKKLLQAIYSLQARLGEAWAFFPLYLLNSGRTLTYFSETQFSNPLDAFWRLYRWQYPYGCSMLLKCGGQLKKYGDSRTSCKSKSPLSGSGGNVNSGYDIWKLSSNWLEESKISVCMSLSCSNVKEFTKLMLQLKKYNNWLLPNR